MKSGNLDEKIAVAVALIVAGAFFLAFLPALNSLKRAEADVPALSPPAATYELVGGSTMTVTP